MAEAEDVLGEMPNLGSGGPHSDIHLKTYTAGEDGSRLAEMAKEFGLSLQRQPRKQVRDTRPREALSFRYRFIKTVLDPSFEDIRMRSIYTSHYDDDDDEQGGQLHARMPSWLEIPEFEGGDEGDPHAQGIGGDIPSAVLGIIKGMVGPAILYLPHGFATAGYATAIPIMIVSTCMFLFSSKCLLDSWKIEDTKHNNKNTTEQSTLLTSASRKKPQILSYPELAYRALGSKFEALVKVGIALMQSGVCLTYLIFVPQNLSTCVMTLFDWNIDASYFLIFMLALQIPMSWIRDIRKLTLTNLLANALILYGLITCLGFAFSKAIKSNEDRGPLHEIGYKLVNLDPFIDGWFLFIGTSVLLFEGSITLLVPLQESVVDVEERKKFPMVYQRVILGIIAFYAIFGISCWMSFGDGVRTVLTTSLPAGFLATSVQFAYSVAVIFTFPLQNFPSLEIACRSISSAIRKCSGNSSSIMQKRNVISSVLVCALAVVAYTTMDSLDKVVSLMGSLLGCPIAFVIPPTIHLQLEQNLTPGRKFANYVCAGMGFCAMVLASITTLATW